MNPAQTLKAALVSLANSVGKTVKISAIYNTPCFPAGAGPDFANAVVEMTTTLSPQAVLEQLHEVEAAFGRKRNVRWDARTLDVDLLDYSRQVLPDLVTYNEWVTMSPDQQACRAPEQLILPHPRIQDRAFVLVPWCDVAPDWTHPVSGKTVRDMCDGLAPQVLASVVEMDSEKPDAKG